MSQNKNLQKVEKMPKANKNIVITITKLSIFFILLFIQIKLMCVIYNYKNEYTSILIVTDLILKLGTLIWLLIRHDDDAYKISWIILIFIFGITGILVYFLWGNSRFSSKKTKEICKIEEDSKKYLYTSQEIIDDFNKINDDLVTNQIKYIQNICGFYLNYNDKVKYLKNGNIFFESLKTDLKNAKENIFIEFYIISKGKLLNEIVNILKQKAKGGVEVSIIFDSLGSLITKPKGFVEDLKKANIKVYVYNKFNFNTSNYINFRSHKKLVVIDSNIAYIGGVNIADEYCNIEEKYGYWKDTGIKIVGETAFSALVMMLRDIELITNKKPNYKKYKEFNVEKNINKNCNLNNGFLICFSDGPNNKKNPMEEVYVECINNAKDYIYISTPYLTMGEVIINSLMYKARSGVKVYLFVPHIPDKKFVQMITRSRYEELLESGIKIYEFKPGFLHAKMLVADDTKALIGSANLDFRSLHLNFESMCYLSSTGEEIAIKTDFEEIKNVSLEIKLEDWKKRSKFKKVFEKCISAFSPLV